MILLVRHCKPEIDYSRCNYKEMLQRVNEYNNINNIDTDEVVPFLNYIRSFAAREYSVIFSSPMPRALHTSKTLFPERKDILFDDKFIEFDLKIVNIPFIKLKFGTWAVISRLLWFAKIIHTTRPIESELQRAIDSANLIHQEVDKGKNVVLVAHGMLNMYIEKKLKSKGYKRISKVKNGFCSVVTLIKHNS